MRLGIHTLSVLADAGDAQARRAMQAPIQTVFITKKGRIVPATIRGLVK